MSSLLSTWGESSMAVQALDNFTSPPIKSRPYIRWWWPHGLVDPDEIRSEATQIADAGFGGIEIQDAHHSIATGTDLDTETHGWASKPWIDAVIAALEVANERGMIHDTAFGPAWPLGVPSITPDDEAAAKEIVQGMVFVNGKYHGAVPSPYFEALQGVHEEKLLAVQAWRVSNDSASTANPVYLDADSMIDLTHDVKNGSLSFTPPDDATWLIHSTIVRGTGQQPEDYPHSKPTTYVVDHFSTAGAQAVIDFWENNILSENLLKLLAGSETAFMEDSLEMVTASYWTPDFPKEFRARRGYDVMKFLPVITQWSSQTNLFKLSGFENQAVLNDYWDTLSELYIEQHIKPLKNWVNSLGIKYRVQAYGIPQLDGIGAAAVADIPEGESLGFEAIDNFRALAGAASLAGKPIVSNELGAYRETSYATTWAMILKTVNSEFAAGVNRNILHGFSYLHAPGAIWPGWAAFSIYQGKRGYSESWGPRHPTWRHVADFTGYMSRAQHFLQQGVAKYDVAFLRQNGAVDKDYIPPWFTATGAEVGWTTAFVDGSLLDLESAVVKNERFAPNAGNFSVIALEADPEGYGYASLSSKTAERLYELAKGGVPVLLVGNWTSPKSYGLQKTTPFVFSTIQKLFTLENVVNARSSADIPSGLQQLGVKPAVRYNASSLVQIRRQDGELDHFFFTANSSSSRVHQNVSVPTRYRDVVPVQLDAWTGNASALPVYDFANGRMTFPLVLEPHQSTFITLMPMYEDVQHAVSSTAALVRNEDGKLAVRAAKAGTYSTMLSDGSVVNTTVEDTFDVVGVSGWTMALDSWEPADGNGDIAATKLVRHAANLTSPVPWSSIDGLEDVSGNATYTTTLSLPSLSSSSSSSRLGAYLDLAPFNGSFRARINGEGLPAMDQLARRFDVSEWVKSGSNKLEVEVAGSLLNRMRVVAPSIWIGERDVFGLGKVTLQPFTQVEIDV